MRDSKRSVLNGEVMRTRRRLVQQVLSAGALLGVCLPLAAQAPPPPPPPPPRGAIRTSGFLPSSTELMYSLRRNVAFESDEAAMLQRLVDVILNDQRQLLLEYGIDADYPAPNIRLSSRDAKHLNDAMDAVFDSSEDEANDFLSRSQMNAFRAMLRQQASDRRNAINAMRR